MGKTCELPLALVTLCYRIHFAKIASVSGLSAGVGRVFADRLDKVSLTGNQIVHIVY